jgi:hypothetical protein
MPKGSCAMDAEQFSRFIQRYGRKVAELDDFSGSRVFFRELCYRFIDGQHLLRRGRGNPLILVEFHPFHTAAMFLATLATGLFYKDASHCFGGSSKKMSSTLKALSRRPIDQPDIRLMHQGRRLQRLPRFS